MIFALIFSTILLAATIICFKYKKYPYLFIPCMLFLPEYYGFEISESLPLLTVTRIMFLIFYIYALLNKRRNLKISGLNLKSIPKFYLFIAGYFCCRIVTNLYYITAHGQATKTILSLIFEQLLLIISFYLLALTNDEINTLIKVTVWSATAMFILGIFESLTFYRLFDSLYTVSRYLNNEHYIRFGLLRATATLGMPIIFGNMCVLMLPLILYMFELTGKKRYLISVALCLFAIIHSGSRANLLFIILIMAIYFVYVLRGGKRILKFIAHALAITASLLLLISILCIANPYLQYFYTGTAKSVLNEVGFNFDLNEDAPANVTFDSRAKEGDSKGSTSRLTQFSGILYTAQKNPIFGLGSGALRRNEVMYYHDQKWYPTDTYDVGYVQIFCDEGLLGSLGFILLAIAILLSFSKSLSKTTQRCMLLFATTYPITLLNSASMDNFLMLIVILAMLNINYPYSSQEKS